MPSQHENKNTTRTYDSRLRSFVRFCQENGVEALPARPETVVNYMYDLLDQKKGRSTITQTSIGAIARAHELAGLQSPTTDTLVLRAKRTLVAHTPAPKQKESLTVAHLEGMARACKPTFIDVRDILSFILGSCGMLRSANINGLLAADVTIGTVGGIEVLKIFIEVSKTDQGREGHTIYLGKADCAP